MTENNNNYNRTFDSKTIQQLKEKEVQTKFSTFKEEVKTEDTEAAKKVEDTERYNDPAEEKKKVNPLLKLVDKLSGKEKEEEDDRE